MARSFFAMPPDFYKSRGILSDLVSACILLKPSLSPSRADLPRDLISCPILADVVRESRLLHFDSDSAVLCRFVARKHGMSQLVRLMDYWVPSPTCHFVLIGRFRWYVAQLVEYEQSAVAFEENMQAAAKLRDRSWKL